MKWLLVPGLEGTLLGHSWPLAARCPRGERAQESVAGRGFCAGGVGSARGAGARDRGGAGRDGGRGLRLGPDRPGAPEARGHEPAAGGCGHPSVWPLGRPEQRRRLAREGRLGARDGGRRRQPSSRLRLRRGAPGWLARPRPPLPSAPAGVGGGGVGNPGSWHHAWRPAQGEEWLPGSGRRSVPAASRRRRGPARSQRPGPGPSRAPLAPRRPRLGRRAGGRRGAPCTCRAVQVAARALRRWAPASAALRARRGRERRGGPRPSPI